MTPEPTPAPSVAMPDETQNGTPMFFRVMAWADNESDRERGELMRKVWAPTPWMVDAHDGKNSGEVAQWCFRKFGPESSPIHGHTGLWHRGNATINGWTWYGFATKAILDEFSMYLEVNDE